MQSRNNVARHAWKFNKAKAFRPKKGKGSFKRENNKRSLFSNSDLSLAG